MLQDLAAKLEELEDMRKSRDSAAAMTAKEKETVQQLTTEIMALNSEQVCGSTQCYGCCHEMSLRSRLSSGIRCSCRKL